MRIVFVVHDLSLTGAPKLGVQIATQFAQHHQVILVAKKDGPLRAAIKPDVFEDFIVTDSSHEICEGGFEERVASATRLLKTIKPNVVYANSVAAGDWISGAQRSQCRSVLHVHEMVRNMLDVQTVFSPYDMKRANLIVAASSECSKDVQRLFGISPERILNFGVCVDIEDVRRRAAEPPPVAIRHDGRTLECIRDEGTRRVIAMCGVASRRKGADLFWHTAQMVREHDFLWIGPWDDVNTKKVNPALTLNGDRPLDNIYWTNAIDNPYAAMSHADLMVLTAREDPNPLIVPEAIAVGVPVATFVSAGGSHYWTSRYGLSLTGEPEPKRLAAFVRRFLLAGPGDWYTDDSFLQLADLRLKSLGLLREVEALAA